MRDQILLLATDNPAFTQDLLKRELGKLDQLVTSFLDLAFTCTRYSMYLRSVDVGQIESESARFERIIDANDESVPEEKEKRALAQKNLAVLGKRARQIRRDRRRSVGRARAARSHREHLQAARRSDRDDAHAVRARGSARRSHQWRRVDPGDRARDRTIHGRRRAVERHDDGGREDEQARRHDRAPRVGRGFAPALSAR